MAEFDTETERDLHDLAGGALVTFIGKAGRISRGGFIWVVTLLCGLEVLGLYSLAWGIIASLNRVARFGLQRGVVRFLVECRKGGGDPASQERVLAASLLVGLASSGLVVAGVTLSADAIAAFYQKPIAEALAVMVWTAPFMTVAWVFTSATRALRIMRFEAYVMSVGGPLILLVGGLVVGWMKWGFLGVAWVQLLMGVGCALLAAWYCRRYFSLGNLPARLRDRLPWRPLVRFSFPVMLTDLLASVLTQLDVLMLGWFVPREQIYLVAIYTLARRLAGIMLKAVQSFDPIFSSIASELSVRARDEELSERLVVISRWILTINLPLFAGLALVGDGLLEIWGGQKVLSLSPDDFEVAVNILLILCSGMMVQGIFAVIEPLLAMSGRPYLNLVNNGVWLAGNFLLNVWLIGKWGIVGAAWGAAAAMLLVNLLRLAEVYRLQGIVPLQASQLKPVGAAAAAACVGWGIRQGGIGGMTGEVVAPLAGMLVAYLIGLYLLGLEEEERVFLRRWTGRGAG